jgi:hypothetical protein
MPGFWDDFMPGEEGKAHSAGNQSKTDPARIRGFIAVLQREKRHSVRFWIGSQSIPVYLSTNDIE